MHAKGSQFMFGKVIIGIQKQVNNEGLL